MSLKETLEQLIDQLEDKETPSVKRMMQCGNVIAANELIKYQLGDKVTQEAYSKLSLANARIEGTALLYFLSVSEGDKKTAEECLKQYDELKENMNKLFKSALKHIDCKTNCTH